VKKEVKSLLSRGIDSLVLAIDHFNKPWNKGRIVIVFMLLNHSFEMLLKAAILHKGGRIREKRAKETIGFDHCVRKCLSDHQVRFLNEDQALAIRTINSLRDAATHYLLDIREEQFYIHVQSGITVFKDILNKVFEKDLSDFLPERVLPVCTKLPKDLVLLIDEEIEEIKKLLTLPRRKISLAKSRLRPIAIMENAVKGDSTQPSDKDLNKILQNLAKNSWQSIFHGIAGLNIDTQSEGLNISLRLTKKVGIPVRLIKEGEEKGLPVAVKRVNELDYYNLNVTKLSKKLCLTIPKALALIHYFNIQSDEELFKVIKIGASKFNRYSPKALNFLKKKLDEVDIKEIWKQYKIKKRNKG